MKKFLWIVVVTIAFNATIVRAESAVAFEDLFGDWRITMFSDGEHTYQVTETDWAFSPYGSNHLAAYHFTVTPSGRCAVLNIHLSNGPQSIRRLESNQLVNCDGEIPGWVTIPNTRLQSAAVEQQVLERLEMHESMLVDILSAKAITVDWNQGVLSLTTDNGFVRLAKEPS